MISIVIPLKNTIFNSENRNHEYARPVRWASDSTLTWLDLYDNGMGESGGSCEGGECHVGAFGTAGQRKGERERGDLGCGSAGIQSHADETGLVFEPHAKSRGEKARSGPGSQLYAHFSQTH